MDHPSKELYWPILTSSDLAYKLYPVNLRPLPDRGTDMPGHPLRTDAHSKPEVASEKSPELLLRDWQPGFAWHASDVRNFAPAAYPGAAQAEFTLLHKLPKVVLPLLALLCLSSVTLPLPGQLKVLSLVYRTCAWARSPGGTTPGWD